VGLGLRVGLLDGETHATLSIVVDAFGFGEIVVLLDVMASTVLCGEVIGVTIECVMSRGGWGFSRQCTSRASSTSVCSAVGVTLRGSLPSTSSGQSVCELDSALNVNIASVCKATHWALEQLLPISFVAIFALTKKTCEHAIVGNVHQLTHTLHTDVSLPNSIAHLESGKRKFQDTTCRSLHTNFIPSHSTQYDEEPHTLVCLEEERCLVTRRNTLHKKEACYTRNRSGDDGFAECDGSVVLRR
jgi:hypothetical protein